jgi:hypothetical protein
MLDGFHHGIHGDGDPLSLSFWDPRDLSAHTRSCGREFQTNQRQGYRQDYETSFSFKKFNFESDSYVHLSNAGMAKIFAAALQ